MKDPTAVITRGRKSKVYSQTTLELPFVLLLHNNNIRGLMGNEDVISWHRKWRHVEKPSGKRRYREKKRVFERAKNNSPVNAAEMEAKVDSYKRYICSFSGCSAAYNKQWKLDAHLCKHTGVKPYSCERDGCSKAFCSKYHLARHELSHSG